MKELDVAAQPWPGVFGLVSRFSSFDAPSIFAKTLCETIDIDAGKTRLLDIGCGSGIIGIYCLIEKRARSVTFNDIQCEAMSETLANVLRRLESEGSTESRLRLDQVTFMKPCHFADITSKTVAVHDLIVFNPPQLPTEHLQPAELEKIKSDNSMAHFRIGGRDGLKVVKEFLLWYSYLNKPKPHVTIVLSSFLGRRRVQETIESFGLNCNIEAETQVSLRSMLVNAAQGFSDSERLDRSLSKSEAGKWTKKLLTITLSDTSGR